MNKLDISIFELKLNEKSKSITTLSELETYMIVKERIEDSKQVLRDQNPENISSREECRTTT